MAKKRSKQSDAEAGAVEIPTLDDSELIVRDLREIIDQSSSGCVVVDPQSKAILYHTKGTEKLLKKKAPKFLTEAFPEELSEGQMANFDLTKKVCDITWHGQPAVLVTLASIAVQQSSFHVEWRIEAAEERAREAEQKVAELQKQLAAPAEAGVGASSAELEALAQQLKLAQDDLADAQSQVQDLQGERDQLAEQLAALEKQFEAEQAQLLSQIQQLQQQPAAPDQSEQLQALLAEKADLLEKIDSYQTQIDELSHQSQEYIDLASQAELNSANKVQLSEDRVQELELEHERLEDRIRQLEQERQDLETQVRHLSLKSEEYEALMHEAEQQAGETEKHVEDLGDSIRQLETRLEQVESEKHALTAQLDEVTKTTQPDQTPQLQELQEQLDASREEIQALEQLVAENQKELDKSSQTQLELQNTVAERQSEYDLLHRQMSEMQATLQLTQLDLETERLSAQELQGKLEALSQAQSQSDSDSQATNEQLETLRTQLEAHKSEAEAQLQVNEQKLQNLQEQLDQAEQRAQELEGLLVIAEERNAEIQENSSSTADVEELQQKLHQLQSQYDALQLTTEAAAGSADDVARLSQELAEAKTQILELHTQLESNSVNHAEILDLQDQLARSQETIRESENQVRALESQIHDFELAKISALAASTSQPEADEPVVEQDLDQLAFEDTLTALPNQNLIRRLLEVNLKKVDRENQSCALIHIDIDYFHVINETLGWNAGDEILQQVAERLKEAVRDSDVVGRKGEDEFLIILTEVTGDQAHPDSAAVAVQRLGQAFAKPFEVGSQKVDLTVSMGISQYPGDAKTTEQLMDHCSTSLRRSKQVGRNVAKFYTAEMQERFEARNRLRLELQKSLEQNHFGLLYQPIISLRNGLLVGVEALLRWNHPSYGRLEPEHFLDVAEESGMLVALGRWIILQACTQSLEWSRSGLDIFVTVNLSLREFLQADLTETIQRSLDHTGALAQNLVFEIPERFQQADPSRAAKVVAQLRKLGVRVALDRFGSAATKLEHLNSDLFQFLKIDRNLVAQLQRQPGAAKVSSAAVQLAHNLSQKSVAVGVENQDQLDICRQLDFDYVQGRLVHAPVEPAVVTDLFKTGRVLR